jgi:DNA-binding NarL/FixJ family response regulator
MPEFRMLLVDDHAIVREGLKHLLCAKGSNWSVVEAETGFQALELLHKSKFDLALVDLSMPGMNGLELISRIKAEFPGMRVLVLSMHAEEQYALRAFTAGADGYATKAMAATELIYAVRKVAAGGAYVTESVAGSVIRQLNGAQAPPHALLTDRELDILRRFAAGHRLTEIGRALHLSVKTVSTHKTRIQEKLHVSSAAELIRYALHNRIEDALLDTRPGHRNPRRLE